MKGPSIYDVMHAPLPPFDATAHCAKCGHDVVTTNWRFPCER